MFGIILDHRIDGASLAREKIRRRMGETRIGELLPAWPNSGAATCPGTLRLSQMTTRSNTPAFLKRWDKGGYATVLTGSKLQWGKAITH